LTVSPKEAAVRILNDATRRGVETHESLEDTISNIEIRRHSENERYMKYYGLEIYDMSLYDIIVDTSGKNPDEVFDEVVSKI
jgi:cytidylate kinase